MTFSPKSHTVPPSNPIGGMPEWTNGAVSKTVEPQGSVGSNPTPSANLRIYADHAASWIKQDNPRTPYRAREWVQVFSSDSLIFPLRPSGHTLLDDAEVVPLKRDALLILRTLYTLFLSCNGHAIMIECPWF